MTSIHTTPDLLLRADEPAPFRVEREHGRSPFLLTADHAGALLPRSLGDLGLDTRARASHIAWDLGIAALGRCLAEQLDAFLILQVYSRLVIDVNRPLGSAESIVTRSEYTDVPGNEHVSAWESARRARAIFQPYHERIARELDRRLQAAEPVALVALHSFTPTFMGASRPFHAGVLYGRDARMGRLLLGQLRQERELVIGDNEPYAVTDTTDYTVLVHGERRGIPYVEIEVRQDLIADDVGLATWSERFASALLRSSSQLFPAQSATL